MSEGALPALNVREALTQALSLMKYSGLSLDLTQHRAIETIEAILAQRGCEDMLGENEPCLCELCDVIIFG